MTTNTILPTDSEARKGIPIVSGVLDYFPSAIAAVAKLSKVGNDKHNPGEPLHWARGKSDDHADTAARHLLERGKYDTDGVLHSVKVAWRALALAQLELEEFEGAPVPRGAWAADPVAPVLAHVHSCTNPAHDMAAWSRLQDGRPVYASDCQCSCGLLYQTSPTGWADIRLV